MREIDIVILGGGPTGLGAAHWLHAHGETDWILFEREPGFGGLARSFRDAHGFTWDIGGHVTFSRDPVFTRVLDELLPASDWLEHERESWIRVLSTWVPYPFQYNLHRLPPSVRADCIEALLRAALNRDTSAPAQFDAFLERTFGSALADLFLRPQNRKSWAFPLDTLGTGWIADRIARPDPVRVARNLALARDDVGWGPNATFRFPRNGGTGRIWTELAATLPAPNLVLNQEATGLDADARVIHFAAGAPVRYRRLVSTLPLDQLARLTERPDWIEQAAPLKHSTVHVVGIALCGQPPPDLTSACWMYFPEPDVPCFRVTLLSRYSAANVADPDRHWSLLAEIGSSEFRPLPADGVAAATVTALANQGLIANTDQVHHTWEFRAEYAYPVPTLDRDTALDALLPALEERNILSRGRFGAWKYEIGNMDHCFLQGAEAARRAVTGEPEQNLLGNGSR